MRVRGMESNATSGYAEAFQHAKNNSRRWKVKANRAREPRQAKDKPWYPKTFHILANFNQKRTGLFRVVRNTYAKR